jgi:type VI secretion system protein
MIPINSLYDALLKPQPIDVVGSIRDHLIRLLNTRRGSLIHLPDYGMPDIGEIYQGLPYSINRLKNALVRLIEYFEPRLSNVHIYVSTIQNSDAVLYLKISAYIQAYDSITFDTYFISGGEVIIN